MNLLADQSSVFYTGPFWFQVVGYGMFFIGALYAAARLQADGLVRHAPWRYWQAACFCLCLWTLSRLTTIALPESSDVGSITDVAGNPILGSPRFQLQRKANGDNEWVAYYPATEKGDPLAEGSRFAPLGGRGEIYYYLQFDVILLVAAGVFALLALNEERGALEERKTGEGADA